MKKTIGIVLFCLGFASGVISWILRPQLPAIWARIKWECVDMWHTFLAMLAHPYVLGSFAELAVSWWVGIVTLFGAITHSFTGSFHDAESYPSGLVYFALIGLLTHVAAFAWLLKVMGPEVRNRLFAISVALVVVALIAGPTYVGVQERGVQHEAMLWVKVFGIQLLSGAAIWVLAYWLPKRIRENREAEMAMRASRA